MKSEYRDINHIRFTSLIAFAIFLLMSIPSIKLLFFSQLVNILSFLLLTSILYLKYIMGLKLTKIRQKLLISWIFFSMILLLQMLNGYHIEDIETLFKYIFLIISVTEAILLVKYDILKKLSIYLTIWGLFIASWQIIYGIDTDKELGQHYLTVSMPIILSLMFVLVNVFWGNTTNKHKIIYLFLALWLFYSLTTLYISRSAFIFPLFILIMMSIIFISSSKYKRSHKIITFISISIITIIMIYYFSENISLLKYQRLVFLFTHNIQEESRFEIYSTAINAILNSPFLGYGTGSSQALFGVYPHNIILEMFTHGGILLFLGFFYLLLKYILTIYRVFKTELYNTFLVGYAAISIFLFLQWNTSYDLSSSFIPIISMVVIIISYDEYIKKKKEV